MRCLACWNDLPAPRAVYTLPCRHVFCLPCAEAAFARELACPTCDTVLQKDGIVEFSPQPDPGGLRDIASGVLGLAPADLVAVLTAGLDFLDGARANEDARWAREVDDFRAEGDRVRKEAAGVRERLEVERLSVARLRREVEEGEKEKAEVQRLYREKVRAGRKVEEKYGELQKVHRRLREDLEAAGRVVGEAEASERDDDGGRKDMNLARERGGEVERKRDREVQREVEREKDRERERELEREREREKKIEVDRERRRERARFKDRERGHRAREPVRRGQKRPAADEPRSHDVGTRLDGKASSSRHDPDYERPRHRGAQTSPVAPRPRDLPTRARADDEGRTRGRREGKRVEATSKLYHVPPPAAPLAARKLRRKSNVATSVAASARPETADDDDDDDDDDGDVDGESRLESRYLKGGYERDRRAGDEPNIMRFPLHRGEKKTGDTGRSDDGGFRDLSPRARVFDLNPGLRKRHRTDK